MDKGVEIRSETPLGLYFGLAEGDRIDLEILAKATLEWTMAVRDIAAVVAPGLDVEIEFVESQEGSVWLRNLLKAARDGDRRALAAVVAGVVMFFAMGPLGHLQSDLGEAFWEALGHKHGIEIDGATREEVMSKLCDPNSIGQIDEHRRKLVRIVERDDAVTSIGVGLSPAYEGPIISIPREQFPYIGSPPAKDAVAKKTDTLNRTRVTIVRASLRGDAKPRWRFSEGETEWSADIEDSEFVEALNLDRTGLHLAVGQSIVVDVAVDSKLVDGAWQEEKRRILNVIEPAISRRQASLF